MGLTARPSPVVYGAVAIGAALGGCLRYALVLVGGMGIPAWPWPTLTANAIGAFVIGVMFGAERLRLGLSLSWRIGLMTGFCGGLTTFSIFSQEFLLLWLAGSSQRATAYLVASLFVWLGMVSLGFVLGQRLDRR